MKQRRSSVSSALCTASREIGRVTRSGAIMYGKTTRSRTGRSGRTSGISSARLFLTGGSEDIASSLNTESRPDVSGSFVDDRGGALNLEEGGRRGAHAVKSPPGAMSPREKEKKTMHPAVASVWQR